MGDGTLTYGALFAGYGGLEMGVQAVLGGDLAWYAEYEPPSKRTPNPRQAAARIMAHHHPTTPNLGDVTQIDWSNTEPVDVLTGGSPCQDLSHAGKRAGMKVGTRSGLWASMCDAIEILQPRLVVWENVRGALSAGADSAVEPCPFCVGDNPGTTLRALGRVLGDLAELGYDAWWYGLRAADVGAAHGRFRVFVFAAPTHPGSAGLEGLRGLHAQAGEAQVGARDRAPGYPSGVGGPQALERDGGSASAGDRRGVPDESDREPVWDGPIGEDDELVNWQEYEAAIQRHEAVFGGPVPLPMAPIGRNGAMLLNPVFVEWMMGLPQGHVTDPAIGLTRNEQLQALGNGVMWQQAAAATGMFLRDSAAIL